MSADVRLEHVVKSFDDVVAVDDLTLEVESGKFYALLGPSGCGKTTTLRMIGGFEEPTSGTIYLGDSPVTRLPPHKRDVNTVFQSYALFPHLTIFENVAFGLRRTAREGRRAAHAGRRDAPRRRSRGLRRTASRASSRAGSSSASRSRARSSTGRACCCSTSRSARST